MSVIRINKTANYTVLSNYHFKEKRMSLKAKGLLSLMLSLPDDWNYSVSGLVKLSKDGKDSVMSALAELETFGYLTRDRTLNNKGQFSGIEYNIFEQPQRENPISENQHADNQNSDNQHAGNPPQLNTKELNTKELNTKGLNTNNIYIEDYETILKDVMDIELRNLYVDYIEMRRNIEAPLSIRGLVMLISRNERLSNFDLELQKALLEAAIMNEWKNVYLPNEQDIQNNNTLAKLKRFYSR